MPTLVIVPGSFAAARVYDNFISSYLNVKLPSVPVKVVSLPSVGKHTASGEYKPPANMSDDAAAIAATVRPLLEQGEDVVVMAHSYGGVPATHAMKEVGSKAETVEGGRGVRKLVLLTALVLPVGVSNWDGMMQSGVAPKGLTMEVKSFTTLTLS